MQEPCRYDGFAPEGCSFLTRGARTARSSIKTLTRQWARPKSAEAEQLGGKIGDDYQGVKTFCQMVEKF